MKLMYKQIETYKEIQMSNGGYMNPIVTLEDKWGGVCQIIKDDHCYVVCLKQEDNTYKPITHIFKEVFEALITLPSPN